MSSVLDTHPDLGPLKLVIQTPNLSESWLLVHDEFSAGFTSRFGSTQAGDPNIIRLDSFIVIVSVPAPVSMCCILDIKLTMPKAHLSHHGPFRLWI